MGTALLGFIGWQKPTLFHLKFSQQSWQEKITESAKLWALLQEFGFFFSSDGPFQADIKAIETRAIILVAKGKKGGKKERKKTISILF